MAGLVCGPRSAQDRRHTPATSFHEDGDRCEHQACSGKVERLTYLDKINLFRPILGTPTDHPSLGRHSVFGWNFDSAFPQARSREMISSHGRLVSRAHCLLRLRGWGVACVFDGQAMMSEQGGRSRKVISDAPFEPPDQRCRVPSVVASARKRRPLMPNSFIAPGLSGLAKAPGIQERGARWTCIELERYISHRRCAPVC